MKSFTYVIQDALGIHARPAGQLVKQAAAWPCSITLEAPTKTVDAKRLLAVMSAAVKQGNQVTVRCEGEREEEAASALEAFFRSTL